MDNTITIVTVVYNDKNNIEKTINSVLNQSYNSKEYIVVDGKSTDGTLEIVKKYADQISVIVSEPDRGIYDAMNKAVDLAHNEWIIFMNSGDVFADNDTLKNVFNEPISKNISFIYSDFMLVMILGRRNLLRHMKMESYCINQLFIRNIYMNYWESI